MLLRRAFTPSGFPKPMKHGIEGNSEWMVARYVGMLVDYPLGMAHTVLSKLTSCACSQALRSSTGSVPYR